MGSTIPHLGSYLTSSFLQNNLKTCNKRLKIEKLEKKDLPLHCCCQWGAGALVGTWLPE